MDLFSGVLPFVHVAEARSFRGGAERLGVTTAAMSKAISRLESELGVTLLRRTSRHVSLTTEGALFLERCRQAVAELQTGRDLVARAQRSPQGTLRVTLPPILGRTILPAVARVSSRHPRLQIHLVLTDRHVKLAEEEIDVAIRMGELEDSSLVARALPTPRWVTLASPGYLARRGTPEKPADLVNHECIKFVSTRGTVREWSFRDAKVETPSRLLLDHGDLLLDAASEGLGIVQVLDFMVAPFLSSGRLIEVLAAHAARGPSLHVVTLGRRASVPRVRVFLEALDDALRR
jgi:DNA-binding transcriptional LysR family regulator